MSSYPEHIKDLLVAANVGVLGATSGWNISIGSLPDSPDTCILIKRTGGLAPNPAWLLDYPSIQVFIRGAITGWVAANSKAELIKRTLLGITSQNMLNGDRIDSITMIGDITDLGLDDNKRPQFSLNFSLIIEPVQTAGDKRSPL